MTSLERFYHTLQNPINGRSRLLLAAGTLLIVAALFFPLWTIHMVAPQYPTGLDLRIYPHTVEGDVQEINVLNHYIGMGTIDRAELSDLDWIPFALGLLVLLSLRVAAIGSRRDAIDLMVLFLYFSAFSMGRFVYKLWWFGHNLDPKAPFQMEPFTPAILGTKEIANFTTTSLPAAGSLLIGLFGLVLLAVVVWNLRSNPEPVRA